MYMQNEHKKTLLSLISDLDQPPKVRTLFLVLSKCFKNFILSQN